VQNEVNERDYGEAHRMNKRVDFKDTVMHNEASIHRIRLGPRIATPLVVAYSRVTVQPPQFNSIQLQIYTAP